MNFLPIHFVKVRQLAIYFLPIHFVEKTPLDVVVISRVLDLGANSFD